MQNIYEIRGKQLEQFVGRSNILLNIRKDLKGTGVKL